MALQNFYRLPIIRMQILVEKKRRRYRRRRRRRRQRPILSASTLKLPSVSLPKTGGAFHRVYRSLSLSLSLSLSHTLPPSLTRAL